jgi:hypothetical protein
MFYRLKFWLRRPIQIKNNPSNTTCTHANNRFKQHTVCCLAILIGWPVFASDVAQYNFSEAAYYTHLKWTEKLQHKIKIKFAPLQNYSGIPLQSREEKAEYYNYGKLPTILNKIAEDAFIASRHFELATAEPDYTAQLIIEDYQLPYHYSPDDTWWQKLHDQTDRWVQKPKHAQIKMSLKLSSADKKIKPWLSSVTMSLSNCDLNQEPQAQTSYNNQEQTTRQYLSTTPGQTFMAATNYLLVKALQRLNSEPKLARVASKFGHEIHLKSEQAEFTQGDVLALFYSNPKNQKSQHAAGKIKVIHANQDHAIAYPLSLRADHIKVGDWVEVGNKSHLLMPESHYTISEQCAKVSSSSAI